MHRRALLVLALVQPSWHATGQTSAAPVQSAPPRRHLTSLPFEEMTPQQRRVMQRRLAGTGKPPLAPEAARRAWNGMSRRERALLLRPRARDEVQRRALPSVQ